MARGKERKRAQDVKYLQPFIKKLEWCKQNKPGSKPMTRFRNAYLSRKALSNAKRRFRKKVKTPKRFLKNGNPNPYYVAPDLMRNVPRNLGGKPSPYGGMGPPRLKPDLLERMPSNLRAAALRTTKKIQKRKRTPKKKNLGWLDSQTDPFLFAG